MNQRRLGVGETTKQAYLGQGRNGKEHKKGSPRMASLFYESLIFQINVLHLSILLSSTIPVR